MKIRLQASDTYRLTMQICLRHNMRGIPKHGLTSKDEGSCSSHEAEEWTCNKGDTISRVCTGAQQESGLKSLYKAQLLVEGHDVGLFSLKRQNARPSAPL